MHRISVHDPSHRLLIRVHVRGGYVFVRPDEINELCRVATGEPFQFTERHLNGIANYAAFSAPEWNIYYRTFPCHPCRKSFDFIQADIRRVAYAALRRT